MAKLVRRTSSSQVKRRNKNIVSVNPKTSYTYQRMNQVNNKHRRGYTFGSNDGTRRSCPGGCPNGECCFPGVYYHQELVSGPGGARGVGGSYYQPPYCGPCTGGAGGRSRGQS